jgi:trans-aconitate methyltransferase
MQKHDKPREERARHWDVAYAEGGVKPLSWAEAVPRVSLELIDGLGVGRDAAVIDVGGGNSMLADNLIKQGFTDVSVLDISATALRQARRRIDETTPVTFLHEDLLVWRPTRHYGLWHDRAVFHFLVDPHERQMYLQTLQSALRGAGFVVLATFAPEGPERCSGLPVTRYSETELAHLLGDGFQLLDGRREEHTTPAGVKQPFTWIAGQLC